MNGMLETSPSTACGAMKLLQVHWLEDDRSMKSRGIGSVKSSMLGFRVAIALPSETSLLMKFSSEYSLALIFQNQDCVICELAGSRSMKFLLNPSVIWVSSGFPSTKLV